MRVARLSKEAGVSKFIYTSSCSVYGIANQGSRKESDKLNPLTAYAKSKALVENDLHLLSDKNFYCTALRFATACGASPRLRLDLVMNDFVASAVLNNYIEILSDGTPWRPLIHVEDMARSIEWALQRETSSKDPYIVVNVGSEEWTFTMESLAQKISSCLGNVDIGLIKW